MSSSIARKVVEGRVAVLLRDVFEDVSLRDQPSIIVDPIRAVMCAPLWLAAKPGDVGTVLGFVYLDSHTRDPFTESDLQVLTVLANFAATKIESARLAEENMEKRRLEEDMRLAAEIQASLLPQAAPRVEGYEICGTTRPSRTVGGDYYDFLVDGDRLHVALGDVSGKGLGAAMLMVALRATVRAYWRDDKLAAAVARMNDVFNQTVPFDKYATFFVGRLDVGHRPAGLRQRRPQPAAADPPRPSRSRCWPRAAPSWAPSRPGPGARGPPPWRPGDTLLVFSDGVSETWPDPDVADRRLTELVRANSERDAATLQAAIFTELDRQSGQRPQDDRTVLIVKQTASGRRGSRRRQASILWSLVSRMNSVATTPVMRQTAIG